MSSPRGIAILGAGIFAKEAHLPGLASLGDNAPPLKAVYSRSEKSAQSLADSAKETLRLAESPSVYYDGNPSGDLDTLLGRDDITAVVVALPITTQPSIILKALEKGKHVLSEKPVAPDVEKGLELIREYESKYKPKGLIWRVAENFEAEPGFQAAKKVIQDGRIGDVQFFRAVVANYVNQDSKWYKTAWRTVPDYQGGFVLDGGVHTIAALRTILPHPLTHISAFASLNKEYLKPHDTINAILKSEGHYHGSVDMTWGFPTEKKPNTDAFVITGSKGWLTINNTGSPRPLVKIVVASDQLSAEGKDQVVEEVIEEPGRGVEAELRSFFDAISGKDDGLGLGNPREALVDVAVIQAALTGNGNLVDLRKLVAA
ncbi:hypothetical protein NMY22_g11701 [Coprinellus aureogranulatus]|nr:hypothetical protein NMY22_g11701 [Coprinellus aureogranulatus]